MKYFKALIIAVCVFSLASCAANQRIIVDPEYKKLRRSSISRIKIDAKHHFMFYGVGQKRNFHVSDYEEQCGDYGMSIAMVDFRSNHWLQSLTFGIYSPRTIKIHCYKKRERRR